MSEWLNKARQVGRLAMVDIAARVSPDMRSIYGDAIDQTVQTRNPVIVIHGILGSRLIDVETKHTLWGGPDRNQFVDPTDAEQLRRISLAMREDRNLYETEQQVQPDGTIKDLAGRAMGLPLLISAYGLMLQALGVGGYMHNTGRRHKRVLDHGHSGLGVCYEFDYDWRLTIPQNAARLADFVETVRRFASWENPSDEPIKVDLVAHSMGGLLARYYLRYGDQPLPDDGVLPKLTWQGASAVENMVLVGTPNAGSVSALSRLMTGLTKTPVYPTYPAAVIGTMPSIYQLMTRSRHERVVNAKGDPIGNLFDVDLWDEMGWGLADPSQDETLKMLLPEADTPAVRRRIALDHLRSCLVEAERFHQALDAPLDTPDSVRVQLFAGDGMETTSIVTPDPDRRELKTVGREPGDGTVTRTSALMDERLGSGPDYPRLLTPINWDAATFLPTGHMGLTRHPTFVNGVLYLLLQKPRPNCTYRMKYNGPLPEGDELLERPADEQPIQPPQPKKLVATDPDAVDAAYDVLKKRLRAEPTESSS